MPECAVTMKRNMHHLKTEPAFTLQCALASLHWMSMGKDHELTGLDVLDAHWIDVEAAAATQQNDQAQVTIGQGLTPERPMSA